ncbi:MAG: hypothetical protein NVS9B3_01430 [Gemmatimonadaceae bacterium]
MPRAYTAKYVVSWALSLVLAAMFLVAGVPKLLGVQAWVSLFHMMGYPGWLRIIVGTAEVVGAAALLLAGSYRVWAAIALMFVVAGATEAHVVRGEYLDALVPATMLVMLAIVGWLRRTDEVDAALHRAHPVARRIVREGAAAGILGATGVAIWFLILDAVAGTPLRTPAVLGRLLFSIFGPVPDGESALFHVAMYTIFHYAAFIATGALIAAVVFVAEREPTVLAGFFMLFVVFEIAFHGLVALLSQGTELGTLAWYQVLAGNVIAAALMGGYMWRLHPELRGEFAHALDGSE